MLKLLGAALLITSSIMVAIVLMWSGSWLTWAYYASDMPVHGTFAFIGPMFVISGFVVPFVAIEEVR
jgi:hypothetical protein